MAYTNAIFHLDYDLGSDAVRTTLSSVVFSNPSADIVLGTKVGHGLVTGAVITVSGCGAAYANNTWKITRVDNDTFTVDTASWASWNDADVTGDVVPFGGQSWADAWKTITAGATAARIAPGDIVRIAKSPVPAILSGATGNATWTNLSKTVTLADAQTATIELCEANWTVVQAVSAATLVVATDAKQGSFCIKVVEDATPVNDEVQAYYDIYTHDTTVHNLSAYQKISFWIKNGAAIAANQLEINLCSNANGTGDVDTFAIPAIASTGRWVALTIARTGDGNLGNAIKSISIANGSNTTEYTASKYVYIDDFIACTTNGLNLQSLISKNSAEQGGTEAWYGIQSINGTTVLLDNNVNTKANQGEGYSTIGTSPETVDTYKRETIKNAVLTSSGATAHDIQDNGSVGSEIEFLGGYDPATNLQDGETFWDGQNGDGNGINLTTRNYITIDHVSLVRFYNGISLTLSSYNFVMSNANLNNNSNNGINLTNSPTGLVFNDVFCNNNLSYGFYGATAANVVFNTVSVNNNLAIGVYVLGVTGLIFNDPTFLNNTVAGFSHCADNVVFHNLRTSGNSMYGFAGEGDAFLFDSTLSEGTEFGISGPANSQYYSHNHENTGYHRIFTENGVIDSVDTDRVGGTGVMWQFSNVYNLGVPQWFKIAKIAVVANKLVTVKAYMKKDHATFIDESLVCRGGQIAGVAADVISTLADNTDWQELTITFTPTEVGVVEIEAWATYDGDEETYPNCYVEDMTITQAD